MTERDIALLGVEGLPFVVAGDDLTDVICDGLERAEMTLQPHDVIVVASTIVSKAEGRTVAMDDVVPSERALEIAAVTEKDPRLVELILRESTGVSRVAPNVLIVRHRQGFVSANAGIDFSNVDGTGELALLLPLDPDGSAAVLQKQIEERFAVSPLGVVISDTHGRAFRRGNVGVAVGVAGFTPMLDQRGRNDLFGRELRATMVPLADLLASAAGLVSGEADEGLPVVIVRGVRLDVAEGRAGELVWPAELDLFA